MVTITNFHFNDVVWFKGLGMTGTFTYTGAGTGDGNFTGGGNASAYFDNANNTLYVDTTGAGTANMEIKLSGVQTGVLHNSTFIVS